MPGRRRDLELLESDLSQLSEELVTRHPKDFGFSPREAAFLRRLTPPWRIQKFLDEIDYDKKGKSCRSPRRVLAERRVMCLDAAIFGAAALRMQGHPPLVLDLEAVQDDDHVLALFRERGHWGAIGRSNFSGLRFREPIFRTLRELALSYFESYFNLRRYSVSCDLSRFDARAWMTSDENLWYISDHLFTIRHFRILTPRMERALASVDRRMFEAGLVGRVWE